MEKQRNLEQKPAYTYEFYRTTQTAWEAMYTAILNAQSSIYWEVFIFIDDHVGERFIKLLCEKAEAGVEVKMVIDALGSLRLSNQAENRLRKAGVDIQVFNRLLPEFMIHRWISRILYRNHRKVLIIDAQVAFLGGVNVHAASQTWHDLYLRLEGVVVRPLLRGFAKSYISSGGKKEQVKHLLHPKLHRNWKAWKEKFTYIFHSPAVRGQSFARNVYLKNIAAAKETINLLTPYYIPDRSLLRALRRAKKRGVKINLFIPKRPDHKVMELIARAYYGLTDHTGTNIYLLPNMNHGKALTVDDTRGVVGSINMTPRSFYLQEELGVQFTDVNMVNDLNAIFNDLKKDAEPFDRQAWKKRGWWERLEEWWARWIEPFV